MSASRGRAAMAAPGPVVAGPVVAGPVVAGPVVAGPVVAGTAVAGTATGQVGTGGRKLGDTASVANQARQMLARAHWAAAAFATYDRESVLRIAGAVARAAHAESRKYAEWAVKETGFGVAEHKLIKNEACSLGVFERYAGEDLVSPRVDPDAKIVALPRPAGVILALIPSTNPIASVYFKVILALLTRNAIVVSPHPMARDCSVDAARLLVEAAVAAGAPDGVIQVVTEPTVRLVETLMSDPVTDVIVATGGTAMVRAAYRSGNPALGVGPGNVPVLVDATADVAAAAKRIVESKAFDNSVLCTNESVLIAEEAIAGRLLAAMQRHQAVMLDEAGRDRLRAFLFPDGMLNAQAIGKDACWIAERAGLRVPHRTRLLLAPVELVLPEEPFCREKLSPVLGVVTVPTAASGVEAARAVVRIGGAGHSAAIHSENPETIMRFGARVPVLRVSVNVGNSTGSSGLETNLAPSMTLGTGFVGRSSIGENLEPRHLVNWTRIAYNADAKVPFGDFTGITPWRRPPDRVPAYPIASNAPGGGGIGPRAAGSGRRGMNGHTPGGSGAYQRPGAGAGAAGVGADGSGGALPDSVRAALRAIIIDELKNLARD